jgi:hypothetical protein
MSISSQLFTAILAMDSYNRGYNNAMNVDGLQIGNASLLDVELPVAHRNLLGIEYTISSESGSFFAQAYKINDGSFAELPQARRSG